MAEEIQEQETTWSGLKKTVIGVVSTTILGVGTWATTKITGGDEPVAPPPAQPSIIINNTQQQQQATSGGGKTVVIKEKEVPVKSAEQPKPVKKKEGDEFKQKDPLW